MPKGTEQTSLGWVGIVRLGLVQAALGSIVVLTTSTLNRVMVVEMMLPAALPGALVALHYAVQLLRPRFGYGSDVGGRRTRWIIGGMIVLATGGVTAAAATAWMATSPAAGIAVAVFAFLLIGVGVGASGTSLLALLAKQVAPERRAAAATVVWTMMITGFVITAGTVGQLLDPFTTARLVAISAGVGLIAITITVFAVWNVERRGAATGQAEPQTTTAGLSEPKPAFRDALMEVWREPEARRFTIFVFVSMLAYSAQDLILEPFAGLVFGMTPGQSTSLAGVQHGGVLLGMIAVGLAGSLRIGSLMTWTVGGCIASSAALIAIASGGIAGPGFPLAAAVFLLGASNGAFAVAAIGSMMALAGSGRTGREGLRMGLWGAAQAIAFGIGGLVGAIMVDLMRFAVDVPSLAYGTVFLLEALTFLVAAFLASQIKDPEVRQTSVSIGRVAGRMAAS